MAQPGHGDTGSGHVDPLRRGLTEALERQLQSCDELGSPLYVRIITALLDDHANAGVTTRLLARGGSRPVHDAVVLRLLSGVHRLVLAGAAPEVARHYPSTGGRPGPALEKDVLALLGTHETRLAPEMRLPVQTNEAGRSVAAMTVLRHPWIAEASGVVWREIGASAGLNLNFPRYAYEVEDGVIGALDSPLRFRREWSAPPGSTGLVMPPVIDVRGCDPHPIDPASLAGGLLLESYVWPDDTVRRERLRAAMTVASLHPPVVDRAAAADWVPAQRAEPGAMLVLFHSIVWQYLDESNRDAVRTHLEAVGSTTGSAGLAWARMEPAGSTADLRLTVWRDGERRDTVIGTIGYHGQRFTADGTPPRARSGPDQSESTR